jgi:serine protease Do
MKYGKTVLIGGSCVLLLGLGTTLRGRAQDQKPSGAETQVAPLAPAVDQECSDAKQRVEQFDLDVRSIEQELQSKLSELQRVKEETMSSPELQKLMTQLGEKKGELVERAQELASQVDGLAQSAQEQTQSLFEKSPNVFVMDSDGQSGWLGVEINEVTAEKAKDLRLSAVRGVIVTDVEPDSPAAKAGLKENDVITKYDGQVVEGAVQFRRLVRETPPGHTVELEISRNGSAQKISVELGDRGAFFEKKMEGKMKEFGNAYAFKAPNFDFNFNTPDFGAMDWRTPVLGINAEDLSGQLGTYFGAPNGEGILVREVRPGTPAEKAGLKAGDVIIKANGKSVKSLADLREVLRDKADQKSVTLGVLRKGSEMSMPVEIEKPKPIEQMHVVHRAQL